MHRELRFKIISEGIKNGVSVTCKKYNVSRTIYYRWLKRYQSQGIDGLSDQKKDFVPVNKTKEDTEKSILNLIKIYPTYGPKAISYLLEELDIHISESAVYNVLKRHRLTRKENRLKYVQSSKSIKANPIPSLSDLSSGECWIFWITEVGHEKQVGKVYAYSFYDLKSHIACTRLYHDLSYKNFEDLLTSVALSIATSLNMKFKYLCFFENRKIIRLAETAAKSKVKKCLHNHGYDVDIQFLTDYGDIKTIQVLKERYTKTCISEILDLMQNEATFESVKKRFQDFVRNYNIKDQLIYDGEAYSPVAYHNHITHTKPILPIWAYMDRTY